EYDERKPQIWRVPLYEQQRPSLTVRAPGAGYVLPAAWAPLVAAKLAQHKIEHRVLSGAQELAVEAFHASEVTHAAQFEGRTPVQLKAAWRPETAPVAAGALCVPIDQPRARLVLPLFEPAAPDSLAAWGYFSAAFEQKEHMEAYVAEGVARRMLAR